MQNSFSTQKKLILSVFSLSFSASTILAQNPGGVSTNLSSWYKADNAATITLASGTVSNWTSSIATGPALSQGTAAQRPLFIAGSTTPAAFSYMPRIRNSTVNQTHLFNTTMATNAVGNTGVIFYVGDQENTGITALTYRYNNTAFRYQFKPSFRIQTSNGTNGYTFDYGAPTEYPVTSVCMLGCLGGGVNQQIRRNSTLQATCSNCNQALYNPAVNVGMYVGANPPGEYTNNDVAEIITFSAPLTAAEINRVESYIAVKYGITRGGNTGALDYVSANSTNIWSTTTNTGYNRDIAGIGRDDASGLTKKQSISVNNNELVTVALSGVAVDNLTNASTFTVDNSFLLWGNNGMPPQSNYFNAACFTNLPSGIQARIERIWKTQATNFSQNVTVGFETSLLTGYTPITNVRLLVDDDGNFSNATVYSVSALAGGRILFNNVALHTGGARYFTLATINYANTPLPIELLSFATTCTEDGVLVNWSTATELNSANFIIERSDASGATTILTTQPAAGNSTSTHTYSFLDNTAQPNVEYYYMLKEVDINGQSNSYFPSSITCNNMGYHASIAASNQANVLALDLNCANATPVTIMIYDGQGKCVKNDSFSAEKGSSKHEVSIESLSSGIYFINVVFTSADKQENIQLLVR